MQQYSKWSKLKKFLIEKQPYLQKENEQEDIIPFESLDGIKYYKFGQYRIAQKECLKQIKYEDLERVLKEGVDNTGQLYWKSEQMLAQYCYQNQFSFTNIENIVELGAGKSGMAGMILALCQNKVNNLILTDGRSEAVYDLKVNVNITNLKQQGYQKQLEIRVLMWGEQLDLSGPCCILISDCLFFENYHDELIQTIKSGLRDKDSFCLICGPSRGGSRERFLKKVKEENGKWEFVEDDITKVNFINDKL